MNQYYLMAQLPSLDAVADDMPLPITEERFIELCNRFLGGKAASVVNLLSLSPSADGNPTGNALVDAWSNDEVELRLALAEVRAEKLNKPYKKRETPFSPALMQVVREATQITNPMEAELYLSRYRLEKLEALRPADMFSLSSVYYYGIKLKLLARIRGFDTTCGKREYKNIYNSIIRGESQEMPD